MRVGHLSPLPRRRYRLAFPPQPVSMAKSARIGSKTTKLILGPEGYLVRLN